MSAPPCTRSWEAEAVVDGRLTGESAAAFERHAGACRHCRSEIAALGRLAALARRGGADGLPPLEHRRQRVALLRRANDDLLSLPRASRARWPLLLVAATLGIALTAYARTRSPAAQATAGGRVLGGADLLRTAAGLWAAPVGSAVDPVMIVAMESPPPAMGTSTAPLEPPPRPAATGTAGGVVAPVTGAPTADPGATFVAAMEAFHDRQFAEADALFVSFLSVATGDARCEDVSFLRAVAHARMGDRQGARTLVARYLEAYPDGLRRAEAERLAASLTP